MAGRFTRAEILSRLLSERQAGRAIYDALCGSGITAKFAARGGADLISTFSLAYYRMQGLSSMAGYLPVGDANAVTMELGERSILPILKDCPVVAGVLGADPTRDTRPWPSSTASSGVISKRPDFATRLRSRCSATRTAQECLRKPSALLRRKPWRWPRRAWITSSSTSATVREERRVRKRSSAWRRRPSARAICDALASRFRDRFITCHGGVLERPSDLQALFRLEPRFDGYVGGSSAERFPIEESVPAAARAFKAVGTRRAEASAHGG